jgi:hypothetical protein
MSVEMDQAADAILQAARQTASLDELSDVEPDLDGSSSLSEIDDKDAEQEEDAEGSDEISYKSEEENDSEAETERLEESPNKFRPQQDVVLTAQSINQTYERSPSKLQKKIIPDNQEDEEDEDPLSEDDVSVMETPESPKSFARDGPQPEPTTAPTSLEDSSGEGKNTLAVKEVDTRKRKRSIMAGTGLDQDLDEPSRKRTGSVMTTGDDYAIGDDPNHDEEPGTSNPISENISGEEGGAAQVEDIPRDVEEPVANDDNEPELPEAPISPKKRGRKKKKVFENGVGIHSDALDGSASDAAVNGDDEARNGEEDHADNEAEDEAEIAHKNEEERKSAHITSCTNLTS